MSKAGRQRRWFGMRGGVWLLAAGIGALGIGANGQGLVEKTIAHVPTSVTSLAVNDNGWVTWTTGRATASQVYLWNRAVITALGRVSGNNRDAQMNNNAWVVWDGNRVGNSATDVFAWKGGGTYVDLSSNYGAAEYAVINNLNDIAWWGNNSGIDDVYYYPHGASSAGDITQFDATGGSTFPALNDSGAITWVRNVDNGSGGTSNVILANVSDASNNKQITNSADLNVYQGLHGINNNGTLVWRQYNDAKLKWDVMKYVPNGMGTGGVITNVSNSVAISNYEPYLINGGTVAWHSDSATSSLLYWDTGSGPQLIPVSQPYKFNRPVVLENTGGLAYASGDSSATGYDIILAEPPAPNYVGGTVTLTDTKDAKQPLLFTLRPINGNAPFSETVTLDANGGFTLKNIPPQSYTLHVKGARWLAANVLVDTTGGNVANVAITLEPGDANGDNVVNIGDFGLLVNAYGSAMNDGTGFYNPMCDFNCDGIIDVGDFGLLVNSYGDSGDP